RPDAGLSRTRCKHRTNRRVRGWSRLRRKKSPPRHGRKESCPTLILSRVESFTAEDAEERRGRKKSSSSALLCGEPSISCLVLLRPVSLVPCSLTSSRRLVCHINNLAYCPLVRHNPYPCNAFHPPHWCAKNHNYLANSTEGVTLCSCAGRTVRAI